MQRLKTKKEQPHAQLILELPTGCTSTSLLI